MVGSGQNLLTTIDTDLRGLGRAAAGHLMQAIAGRDEPGVHLHPGRLVTGEFTIGESREASPGEYLPPA